MSDAIELTVGIACLAIAWVAWPRGGTFRLVAVVMLLAGLAAVGNAVRSALLGS